MISVRQLLLIFLLFSTVSIWAKETLKICVDNGNWRPFVYQENGIVTGLHIDTVNQALKESQIPFEYIPSPWKRCLKGAEKGVFDAIATASFNKERSKYLIYPDDTYKNISEWRVGQVQYNIIVHQSNPYDYKTDLIDIPQPTRVPRDYSIGKDLKVLGFSIDDSSINDLQNLKRLVREKTGSVIALPSLVEWANQQQEFAGKIKLIEKPIKSKSYFLAFSKKGLISKEMADKIWQNIKAVREKNQYREYLPNSQ